MPRRAAYPNPAWTNAILQRDWADLERLVGPGHMPRVADRNASRLVAEEYGSGVYGTVLPTRTRGIVLKLTTDATEAHVAFVARGLRPAIAGLVHYGAVVQLEGRHEGYEVFALWREEADDVGRAIARGSRADYDLGKIRAALDPTFRATLDPNDRARLLPGIVDAANRYEDRTGFEGDGGGPDVLARVGLWFGGDLARDGFDLDVAVAFARDLAAGREVPLVGRAILALMGHGILLADVHPGNVGRVVRGGKRAGVITDPGNTAFLAPDYDRAWPPTLEQALRRNGGSRRAAPASRASRAESTTRR